MIDIMKVKKGCNICGSLTQDGRLKYCKKCGNVLGKIIDISESANPFRLEIKMKFDLTMEEYKKECLKYQEDKND